MDSPETMGEEESEEEEEEGVKWKDSFYMLCRSCFRLFLTVLGTFSLSILVLFVAVLVGNLSIWNPILVHTRCKIVSTSVDLRTSKVCELGLLNYRAKHVFYPHERKKFRCRYDYYWASVLKVKYADHSGQERLGLAEVPDEALPLNCRPSFGGAWLTKNKFKVNETFDCWYTLGVSKVNIQQDDLFNCQAKDPSTVEMLRRYIILSMRILESWITSCMSLESWRLDVIAGVATGFATSLVTVGLVTTLYEMMSFFRRNSAERTHGQHLNAVRFKRACFYFAYFAFMGWLTLEYVKRMGLPDISGVTYSW